MRPAIRVPRAAAALLLVLAASPAPAQRADTLRTPGLRAPVQILTDRWGINHIYAQSQPDLFFAQGYAAARDRLFQLEIWRRQATGTVAEILGPRELERDIGTRLFKFRGDLQRELAHYHPDGEEIVTAFVRGINAYIAETERDPGLLPLEFRLLGITPQRWTPEVVISRHQGLLGNVRAELDYGRAVAAIGPDAVLELEDFGPGRPDLALDPAIDGRLLDDDILARYDAFRRSIRFRPDDVVPAHRADPAAAVRVEEINEALAAAQAWRERRSIGSNNWVVSGRLSASGSPLLANDPHRAQAAPSLRYWAHLVAPGWNVIGGGEPVLPGISIGHNEHGAWGLTVFATDSEDLYVYETNPADPGQYRYRGGWEAMRVIRETIPVKGAEPFTAELRYTRHGPVVYRDTVNHRAYAVRAAWMEVGGAPYLASLRMNQARSWEEFREACSYSHIPGENMIWADRAGNIGWQAVGIAPIRRNWSGLVPVPGDGRYEWDGYLPIKQLPHALNPAQGFIATANNNLIPPGYPHRYAVGWEWSDPYRFDRIVEVLSSGRRFSVEDMTRLQTDVLSIPARTLVPLLERLRSDQPRAERARDMLLGWDHRLEPGSVPAGIYVAWERRLRENVEARVIPEAARRAIRGISMSRTIELLRSPDGRFGSRPAADRDALLVRSLEEAVADLTARLGEAMDGWRYGQERYKHVLLQHPLGRAVDEETRRRLEVGPLPRGGNAYTPNATGGNDNQSSGASFRIVVDTGDWDAAVGTNTPGQSGNPDHPHYRDLFELWATDRYFPALYSRAAVESVTGATTVLLPGGGVEPGGR